MPATAGRVRMPANNRVHSSAALQTHGIWQSAIGYDPYAPDQKQPPAAPAADRDAPASLSGPSADQQNAYDSFQGLLALARLTGSNADEARGACRKCGRVGHLSFQCRNFLALKDEAALAAAAAASSNFAGFPDSVHVPKEKAHDKRRLREAGHSSADTVSELSSEDDTSESDESGLSDSSEDSEMERAIAAKFGKNVLKSLSKKNKLKEHRISHSKRRKSRKEVSGGNSEEEEKKAKHRTKTKRNRKDMSGSDESSSDSGSEDEPRRKKRRHSHRHSKRSKPRSKHSHRSSKVKHAKKEHHTMRHKDRKHD